MSATVPPAASSTGPATSAPALVVRTATDAELDAAGTVAREAFVDDGIGEDEYSEVIADARSRAEVADVLVALEGDDGPVLGTVTFALHSTPFADVARPGEAEFRMLGVLESARGRGVGAALVKACTVRARASGAEHLVLSVHEDAAGAHRLYERLGFVRDPERDWDPAPGVHLLFCSLDLRAPTP